MARAALLASVSAGSRDPRAPEHDRPICPVIFRLDRTRGLSYYSCEVLPQELARGAAPQRLQEIEGIGPLSATALVAALGNGHDFQTGRQVAVWLGLVPRQHSRGGMMRLGGITKGGNSSG
jgi:hypothetical protein